MTTNIDNFHREILQVIAGKNGRPVGPLNIGSALGLTGEQVRPELLTLEQGGYLNRGKYNLYSLSEAGRAALVGV